MDIIYFNEMKFYGYHGVFPEENTLGQRYVVDMRLYLDLKAAGQSDQLGDTIDYAEVYAICQTVMEKETYQLVEKVAEQIAQRSLAKFTLLDEVVVRVTKPDPPIAGHYQSVAVEIRRGR
ncbi:dihydroneopterin aldolase [Ammoniphilus oxalaticus]|uniref:7,8-dihydroneopterin aldolase n=1 Tax=Ammoniphilus oxalaticus TaxID=66863 RepID=A0A419SG68_9BACL|nr:dihydroneopterin aldolase [Ammoniphilus oxalaticus]RKD22773.1 dihydroneopterin aldolase [Ammoniphilus oxalaticus]